jgi:membrane-associated phospholipid phosphatase
VEVPLGSGRPQRTLVAFALVTLALPFRARAQEAPAAPPEAPARPAEAAASPAVDRPHPDDGRRTGARFLANFGRDTVGVFSSDNLVPFLVSAGVSGGGALFDNNVQNYFAAQRRAQWLGNAGDRLGQAYVIGPLAAALFGAGRLARDQRFRDATYDIAEVTLVAVTYTTALKYATQRPRPDGSDKLSFPSGHTSNAFAWATVGAHYYGWKLGVPGYLLAGLIGVSRMEIRAHHLSDVLAGAGIGYIVGRTAVRRDGEPLPGKPRVRLAPGLDPQGSGAGLVLTVTF